MAVTITSPKSVYVDDKDSSTYTLQWTTDVSGQTAYEILYKKKTATEWSTLGKVESTSHSFDLREIYNAVNLDIEEFYYRVLIYYSGDDYTGKEYSDVYSVMFNEGWEKRLKVYRDGSIVQYPLLNDIKNTEIESMPIQSNGKKKIPLVELTHPLAKGTKIQTSNGKKQFASNDARFDESGIYGNGEFSKYIPQYTQEYAYRQDENYAYNRSEVYGYQAYYGYAYKANGYGTNYGYYKKSGYYQYLYYDNRSYYYYFSGYRSFPTYTDPGGTTHYQYVGTYSAKPKDLYRYAEFVETYRYISGYAQRLEYHAVSHLAYYYGYIGNPVYGYHYEPIVCGYTVIYSYKQGYMEYGTYATSYYTLYTRYQTTAYRQYITGYKYYSYLNGYTQYSYLSSTRDTSYSYTYYT